MRSTCIFTMIASLIIILIFAFGLLDELGTLVALGTASIGVFMGMVISIYADLEADNNGINHKEQEIL